MGRPLYLSYILMMNNFNSRYLIFQFANDECDYGMGFEMGMCVFSHKTSHNFLGERCQQ